MAALVDPYDFSDLLHMGRPELRAQLAQTVAELCTSIENTAFIRATATNKDEYLEAAGHRDALNELKWLIMKLMEDASPDV